MPPNVRIIICPEFIRHDAAGTFDAEATRACLSGIAAECDRAGVRDALLDVRAVTDPPSISELFWVAEELGSLGFSPRLRLAVVFTDIGGGRAAFFSHAAHNRGFNVREFTDFEAAFNWLSSARPVPSGDDRGGPASSA